MAAERSPRGGGPKPRRDKRFSVDAASRETITEMLDFYREEHKRMVKAAAVDVKLAATRDRVAQELHRWLSSYVSWGLGSDPEGARVVAGGCQEGSWADLRAKRRAESKGRSGGSKKPKG